MANRSKPLEQRLASLTARLRSAEAEAYRRGVMEALGIMRERGVRSGGRIDADETAREVIARLLCL